MMATAMQYKSPHSSRPSYQSTRDNAGNPHNQQTFTQARPPAQPSQLTPAATPPAAAQSSSNLIPNEYPYPLNDLTATPPYHVSPSPPVPLPVSQLLSPTQTYSPPASQTTAQIPALLQTKLAQQIYPQPQYQDAPILPTQEISRCIKPLTDCPSYHGTDGVYFTTIWYRIRGIPGFDVCSHCYQTRVAGTEMACQFEKFTYDPNSKGPAVCDFNSERARHLLQRCLQTHSINDLAIFAQRRKAIKSCPGSSTLVTAEDGVGWYGIAEIPEFTCCEACYEDFVVETPFTTSFGQHQLQRRFEAGEGWFCNMAEHFIRRTFIGSAIISDWSAFVGWTRYRMSITDCAGYEEVEMASRKWYKANGIDGIRICEACYLDHAGNTEIKDKFKEVTNKWYQAQKGRCDLAQLSMQLCTKGLIQRDFRRWHLLVKYAMLAPVCVDSVQNGEFYTVTNPKTGAQTDFGVCERCFLGFVESSGHGIGHTADRGGMWRKTRFPGLARCDFHPASRKFQNLIAKYKEMVLTGCESVLVDFVVNTENLKPCPQSMPSEEPDRLWWGTDEFLFCEECYESAARDTYFAASFKWQGHRMSSSKCDMYSDNMRKRYVQACQQQSLDDLSRYCQERNAIWKATQVFKASQRYTSHHNMSMGMSQLIAASNEKHNAMMWGVSNVGGNYNSRYDTSFQSAQLRSTQAWNEINKAVAMGSVSLADVRSRWEEVE